MSIKTEELKKIEKGCGKEGDVMMNDKFDDLYICQEDNLCSTCQAKKTQTIELYKKFEDEVNKLMLDCPIQKDKACWCLPLEKLKDRIFGDEK